ncbi:hypothetical protein GE061_000872 [Apolygus lucorum]|uniref:Uncharacterized protein n=1 Tax=Apolygus lucorum TaxID=248454 RepID=A0A8S9Y721_APOLU|nr:hypothetical protein GE061_000872 [Apolygus lucorum]
MGRAVLPRKTLVKNQPNPTPGELALIIQRKKLRRSLGYVPKDHSDIMTLDRILVAEFGNIMELARRVHFKVIETSEDSSQHEHAPVPHYVYIKEVKKTASIAKYDSWYDGYGISPEGEDEESFVMEEQSDEPKCSQCFMGMKTMDLEDLFCLCKERGKASDSQMVCSSDPNVACYMKEKHITIKPPNRTQWPDREVQVSCVPHEPTPCDCCGRIHSDSKYELITEFSGSYHFEMDGDGEVIQSDFDETDLWCHESLPKNGTHWSFFGEAYGEMDYEIGEIDNIDHPPNEILFEDEEYGEMYPQFPHSPSPSIKREDTVEELVRFSDTLSIGLEPSVMDVFLDIPCRKVADTDEEEKYRRSIGFEAYEKETDFPLEIELISPADPYGKEDGDEDYVIYKRGEFKKDARETLKFMDAYENEYIAFSKLFIWANPHYMKPTQLASRPVRKMYGDNDDIVGTKVASNKMVKKLVSRSLKNKIPNPVKFRHEDRLSRDPVRVLASNKGRKKSSAAIMTEYMPYFRKPTLKNICPALIGHSVEAKRAYLVRKLRKKLFETSLISKNPNYQTTKRLFKRSHIYWLLFASQLFFHLKCDRGWETIEEQILKLFGFIRFSREDYKEIEVSKDLWQRVVGVCQASLRAMQKEMGRKRKHQKTRTKYHSDKVFLRYMYWKVSPYDLYREPKKPIQQAIREMGLESSSEEEIVRDPNFSWLRMINYRGKSDNIIYKLFNRTDEDMRMHDIMSKYELSHFIGRDPGKMKLKMDFKRLKSDVINMWDSKRDCTMKTILRDIDSKLMYWFEKHMQTGDAIQMMQNQVNGVLTTRRNMKEALYSPLLLLDTTEPLDVFNDWLWNSSTDVYIEQNSKDDEWAFDDEYSYISASTATSHGGRTRKLIRKEKKAAKNRHFMQCCKVIHTHVCVSVIQKLAYIMLLPEHCTTKMHQYKVEPTPLRGAPPEPKYGNIKPHCCCLHPICRPNCPKCRVTKVLQCHCEAHAAPGIMQRRIQTLLAFYDRTPMNPAKQEMLFNYFWVTRIFEHVMTKGEIVPRIYEGPHELDYLYQRTFYYRELLWFLKTNTCVTIDEQIRNLLDHNQFCMKYKGRRKLYYRYCPDFLKFPLENEVCEMEDEDIEEFLLSPGHPFRDFIFVTPNIARDRKIIGKQMLEDLHLIYKYRKLEMEDEIEIREFFIGEDMVCNFEEWRPTDDRLLLKRNFLEIEARPEEEEKEEPEVDEASTYSLKREVVSPEKSILDVLRPPESASTIEILSRISPERSELDVLRGSQTWSNESVMVVHEDEEFAADEEDSKSTSSSSSSDKIDELAAIQEVEEMLSLCNQDGFRAERLTSPDYRIQRERSVLNVLAPSTMFTVSEVDSLCSLQSMSSNHSRMSFPSITSIDSSGSSDDKDVEEQIAMVFDYKKSNEDSNDADSKRSSSSSSSSSDSDDTHETFVDFNRSRIFDLLGQSELELDDLDFPAYPAFEICPSPKICSSSDTDSCGSYSTPQDLSDPKSDSEFESDRIRDDPDYQPQNKPTPVTYAEQDYDSEDDPDENEEDLGENTVEEIKCQSDEEREDQSTEDNKDPSIEEIDDSSSESSIEDQSTESFEDESDVLNYESVYHLQDGIVWYGGFLKYESGDELKVQYGDELKDQSSDDLEDQSSDELEDQSGDDLDDQSSDDLNDQSDDEHGGHGDDEYDDQSGDDSDDDSGDDLNDQSEDDPDDQSDDDFDDDADENGDNDSYDDDDDDDDNYVDNYEDDEFEPDEDTDEDTEGDPILNIEAPGEGPEPNAINDNGVVDEDIIAIDPSEEDVIEYYENPHFGDYDDDSYEHSYDDSQENLVAPSTTELERSLGVSTRRSHTRSLLISESTVTQPPDYNMVNIVIRSNPEVVRISDIPFGPYSDTDNDSDGS